MARNELAGMSRVRVALTLFVALVATIPSLAVAQIDGVSVEFLILVAPEHTTTKGPHCYIATASDSERATLQAVPTPYEELASDSNYEGRMVTEAQSPIPGREGCLLEFELDLLFADSYEIQLIVSDYPNDWSISLGDMSMGDIIEDAPGGIKFYFDQDTFDTGIDSPEVDVPVATPSLQGSATVTVLLMITDKDQWQEMGDGCIGVGGAEWVSHTSRSLVAADGSTTGVLSEEIGIGSIGPDGSCSWTLPKTPPIEDTGGYHFAIDKDTTDCSTEDMARLDTGYLAVLAADERGLHCARVTTD